MEEEVKKEICKNLKLYRRKSNLTQAEVAEKLGLSIPAVSQWEKGLTFPEFTKLYDLCKLLNISIDDLLGNYALGVGLSSENRDNIKKIKEIAKKITI